MFEHFERLSIGNFADAVRDRCNAVVQVHLPGRNVHHLALVFTQVLTAGAEEQQGE
jgi:hypothetical protein